jgi:hypothetical protein
MEAVDWSLIHGVEVLQIYRFPRILDDVSCSSNLASNIVYLTARYI